MPGMFTLQMERKELLSDLEIVERSNFCQQGLDRKLTFVFFVAQQGNEHYFYFVKVTKCKLIINMSLKANIAIVLHLHSFKNLALPHKARYALRTTIYQGKNQKVTAMPFNIIETETKPKKNVSSQGELQDILFLSKRFNIQYQEQQIQLNDCCQFRLTLQSFPQLKDEDLYLEFTLVENVSCYFREQINSKVELKEVESYRFKLQNIATGIFRYCQGQFSKAFISSFSFTFFAMITDYRFHPYTARAKSDSPKQKARQRVENIEQLMKWAEKYLKNSDDGSRYFYQHYVKDLRYNSFCIQSEVNSCLRKSKGEIYPKVPTGEGGELVTVNDKQFFDYVTSYFPEKISQGLIKLQIHRINQQNFYFLQNLGNAMSKGGIDMKLLRQKFRTQRRDLFGERVFRSIVFGKAAKDKDHNNKTASKMRKKKKINELKIIDQHLFMKKQNQHYAFIQVNLPHSLKTKEYQNGSIDQVLKELTQLRNSEQKEEISYDQRNMLVVLVHGFQATSYDMEIIRRQLMRKLPVAMFLNSTANEHDTTGDIELMGKKLADEIKSYINRFIDNQNEVIINLVGHSMGGIIARAALPYLQAFQKQLGFYFSLSSPHIGYINGVDLKIKAGLWFMRKTNKILSLDQLSMQEKQSMKQTFLYKLSSSGHLLNFKKVILLSSSEDSYVPWHSARVEYYDGSGSGSKLEKQMVENILGDQIVHRIDIHFDIQTTKDIDSFIGRAAHINLLTQQSILKLVNEAIPNLFEYKQL